MSTRCMIHFVEEWDGDLAVVANIYRHSDGYPDGPNGVPADMERFFAAVREHNADTKDFRFDHASYLAARFIVWKAMEMCAGRLNFLGLGVDTEDHADIAYVYRVECAARDRNPRVQWRRANDENWSDP